MWDGSLNPPPTNGWSEPVQTRVTRETKEKLLSLADKENRSISSIIRDAIESYLSVIDIRR